MYVCGEIYELIDQNIFIHIRTRYGYEVIEFVVFVWVSCVCEDDDGGGEALRKQICWLCAKYVDTYLHNAINIF